MLIEIKTNKFYFIFFQPGVNPLKENHSYGFTDLVNGDGQLKALFLSYFEF